jgi:cell division protease FtsH
MVAHFGMSERVGPVFHEHRTEHPFLGQTLATDGGTSDATIRVIEQETRELLLGAAEGARNVIGEHRDALERLVALLLEQESVEKQQLLDLLGPAIKAPHAMLLEEPLHSD